MKHYLLFILIILTTIYNSNSNAQNENTSVLLNLNLNFPTGSYEDKIGNDAKITRRFGFDFGGKAGLASTGFGFGAEVTTPILFKHFGWLLSAKLIINPTDNSEVKSFFQKELENASNISIETGDWYHIPIMTGFSYGYKVMEDLNIYLSLLGGINISHQASRQITVDNIIVEKTNFDTEVDFGYDTGITFELFNKYNIGLKYINLGNPRYEGNRYLNEKFFEDRYLENNPVLAEEKNIKLFLITLGYRI